MAAENAALLCLPGWQHLTKSPRGLSALNDAVGSLPHKAAGYLDYLRKHGAPMHSAAPHKSPEELQAAVDRGPHQSAVAHKDFL